MGQAQPAYETSFEDKIRKAEFDLLLCANVPLEQIQRRSVHFEYGEVGKPWRMVSIRTIIISDKDEFDEFAEDKPTLVMIHGFGAAGVMFWPLFKSLLEHFRIVTVDLLGFGGSSRVQISEDTYSDQQTMDDYIMGWLTKWLEKCTQLGYLPEKFNVHGHSYGGYVSSLFACMHPTRVEALFLNSPIGPEALPDDFDPMHVRMSSGHQEPPGDTE